MPIGAKPENLTRDEYLDTEPAWSPDERSSSTRRTKGGRLLQLRLKDLKSGQEHRLSSLDTQPMGASWSPDPLLTAGPRE